MQGSPEAEANPTATLAELEQVRDTLLQHGFSVQAELLDKIDRLRTEMGLPANTTSKHPPLATGDAPRPTVSVGSPTLNVEHQSGGATVGVVQGDVHVHREDWRSREAIERPAEALQAYRRWVAATCERVTMRLLAPEENDVSRPDRPLELSRMYVDLDTAMTEQAADATSTKVPRLNPRLDPDRATRRLSVLDVMARQNRLILLGQPGFGKSTLAQHTALCLARDAGAMDDIWGARIARLGYRGIDVLPVFVVLRDLAPSLPTRLADVSGEVLRSFLEERLRKAGLLAAADPLWKAMEEGKALVLLDGLDEVPGIAERQIMRGVVEAFEQLYPKCRYVVTCRVLTWAQEKLAIRGFAPAEIAPFDATKILTFVDAWHAELVYCCRMDAASAERLRVKLREAVQNRPGLAKLAENPLLLTVMAVVHTKGGELPEGEAPLYRDAVDVLLWRWQDTVSTMSPKKLLEEVGAPNVVLLEALRRLAFNIHGASPIRLDSEHDAVADIPENALLEALIVLDPKESRQWARRLVDALKTRAGLLVERAPQLYTFPHRTFQELLAGWHLALQHDFEVQASKVLRADPTRWRKAVLLAAGLLAAELRLGGLKALLNDLCPAVTEAEDIEPAWRAAWWAGEVLDIIGPRHFNLLRADEALVERVRNRLRALVEGGKLLARQRVEVGRVLGRLGDPRFRQGAWGLPADKMLGFVQVPQGTFWMGSKRDEGANDGESPRHRLTLPEFWIARYPVTVGQWRAFVQAVNFRPQDADSLKGADNEPVRLVSWHEAVAYIQWLDATLRTWAECPPPLRALFDATWHVKLPSEAEWERVAGAGEKRAKGRSWPWGDEFDNERANTRHLALGDVSPVGCFPLGATPEGIHDMSGNVSEWTRSVLAEYPYEPDDQHESMTMQAPRRVLRGGSFGDDRRCVRCSYRIDLGSSVRAASVGFRLSLNRS